MKREQIEQQIEQFLLEKIKDTQLELVDVEYVRELHWFLRIYLDKPGGLEIDDCQYVSEFLNKYLDSNDLIKEKYYLEVSSPGLDRQLKKTKDFLRYLGTKVDVSFFKPWNGKKKITGQLGSVDDHTLELLLDESTTQVIERNLISTVRLHLDF